MMEHAAAGRIAARARAGVRPHASSLLSWLCCTRSSFTWRSISSTSRRLHALEHLVELEELVGEGAPVRRGRSRAMCSMRPSYDLRRASTCRAEFFLALEPRGVVQRRSPRGARCGLRGAGARRAAARRARRGAAATRNSSCSVCISVSMRAATSCARRARSASTSSSRRRARTDCSFSACCLFEPRRRHRRCGSSSSRRSRGAG